MISTPADLVAAIKSLIADYEEHQRLPAQSLPAGQAPAAHPRHPPAAGAALSVEDMAREAAQHGRLMLVEFYRTRNPDEQQRIVAIKSELEQLYPEPPGPGLLRGVSNPYD